MKMFKRFAAALLVGVMALAMLTACGGSGKSDLTKVEDIYLKVVNTILSSDYKNDATLQDTARRTVSETLKADGTLVSGKKLSTATEPDANGIMTVSAIMVDDKGNAQGLSAEDITKLENNEDALIAEIQKEISSSGISSAQTEIIKKAITKVGVGSVKKNDKVYTAIVMEIDTTKIPTTTK